MSDRDDHGDAHRERRAEHDSGRQHPDRGDAHAAAAVDRDGKELQDEGQPEELRRLEPVRAQRVHGCRTGQHQHRRRGDARDRDQERDRRPELASRCDRGAHRYCHPSAVHVL